MPIDFTGKTGDRASLRTQDTDGTVKAPDGAVSHSAPGVFFRAFPKPPQVCRAAAIRAAGAKAGSPEAAS